MEKKTLKEKIEAVIADLEDRLSYYSDEYNRYLQRGNFEDIREAGRRKMIYGKIASYNDAIELLKEAIEE